MNSKPSDGLLFIPLVRKAALHAVCRSHALLVVTSILLHITAACIMLPSRTHVLRKALTHLAACTIRGWLHTAGGVVIAESGLSHLAAGAHGVFQLTAQLNDLLALLYGLLVVLDGSLDHLSCITFTLHQVFKTRRILLLLLQQLLIHGSSLLCLLDQLLHNLFTLMKLLLWTHGVVH
ncbi:hypothetical protein P4H61_12765 [Paenibacillus peoriae]|uniref:hypothetical protein n=1 Tax=Paenibacillus peoriae TaxID=59893 RepID=UPI000584E2C2|nr:hypothetical protein [Paenibacillus peoriae]MEC0182353.1 hypothetical protein [Paenibacillus peoriae]